MERTATLAREIAISTSPIRLVRLRLALLLVATAVLPLALSAAMACALGDSQRATGTMRAERDAAAVGAAVAAHLDAAGQALIRVAADPAITALLDTRSKAATAAARPVLLPVGTRVADGVHEAAVIDATGRVLLRLVDGKIQPASGPVPSDDAALAGGLAGDLTVGASAYRSAIQVGPEGSATVSLAAPIPGVGGVPPRGVVTVTIDVAALLASAAAGAGAGVVPVRLTDGRAWVTAGGPAGPATTAAGGPTADVVVPGLPGWRAQISAVPAPQPLQSPLFVSLAAASVVLFGLILVMARRILRPAEELEASRKRLRTLYEVARMDALRDGLTGLGNHRAFHEEFDRQIEFARRTNIPLALVLIDLDEFKMVNDTAGHAAGDELLAEMGRLTSSIVRAGDRAFRIGGDEFAILLANTNAEGGRVMARRLLAATLEPRGAARSPGFSVSAGISSFPNLAADRRQLYGQADAALYWAKSHGRTMVHVFDPAVNRDLGAPASNGDLSAAVIALAQRRAVRPVYQPIIELKTGRVMGYEGLVRPTLESGFANAGELFDAAERTGRQAELDQVCLEAVISGAVTLAPETLLTLNVSPRSLEAPEFSVAGLVAILERCGIAPGRVILELTERESIDDLEQLRRNVAAARAAGLRLAADDVGAGNAGLRLLSQVRFDIVKIDLSLVQDGAQQRTSLAVVGSLQELARRWGAWVIAEGVETAEQLEVIRGLGITAAQGYLLARPGDSLTVGDIDLELLLDPGAWMRRLSPTPTLSTTAAESA